MLPVESTYTQPVMNGSEDGIDFCETQTVACTKMSTEKRRRDKHCRPKSSKFGSFGSRRYQRKKSHQRIALPNRFLLGGTITDPLNLNSMDVRETFRAKRRKVVSCLLPANMKDPLNLDVDNITSTDEKQTSSCSHSNVVTENSCHLCSAHNEHAVKFEPREGLAALGSCSCYNKTDIVEDNTAGQYSEVRIIVSPAVKQSPEKARRIFSPDKRDTDSAVALLPSIPKVGVKSSVKKRRTASKKYSSGNYLAYYGYRNAEKSVDPRLLLLSRDLFEGKDVLDIGCNSGFVTLTIARDFLPRRIVGIDVDSRLIESARRSVCHFLNGASGSPYPASMHAIYGPVFCGTKSLMHNDSTTSGSVFPNNVLFQVSDYVLPDDQELGLQQEEFDVILAFSVTKWFHLNHGDDGLRRCFQRMYRQLRPNGRLVLEAQPWSSYKRRKNLTEKISSNYKSISFFPDKFNDYLLSREVGFSSCELVGTPSHKSKGFQRSLYVFSK